MARIIDKRRSDCWEKQVEGVKLPRDCPASYARTRNTISQDTIKSALMCAQAHERTALITKRGESLYGAAQDGFGVTLSNPIGCIVYATVTPDGDVTLLAGIIAPDPVDVAIDRMHALGDLEGGAK